MYSALELCNRLRSEAGRVSESGLPLEVFPQKVQEIIFNLAAYENFNIEYSASIVLSAAAAAIGNACQIQIKGNWRTSPSVYMMLVGRPGLGKTPPLSFLYRPIHEQDDRMFEQYLLECDEYERTLASSVKDKETDESILLKKPRLVTTVISDFTPEALMNVHQHNLRGVAVEVDEILAMFNSVRRYNSKNNLIEDLLSTYSGRPLKSVRKSEARPILIRQPCINVIGSVQTNLLPKVFRNEYKANGLLDRFLFVYPKDQRISKWQRTDRSTPRPDTMGQWRTILNRILSLPCPTDETGNTVCSLVLAMEECAEACFYDWYNGIIDTVNAVRDDAEVDSRKTKLDGNAARLALVFQILKWASGEGHMQHIDLDSVKAAIRMTDYYEDTYRRIQECIVSSGIGDNKEAWLSLLGDTFTAGDAVIAGKKVELSRRTVYYALDKLSREPNPVLEKLHHGTYRKTTAIASCSIALSSEGKAAGQSGQSAKVQCASDNTAGL
ncbi:MULTISPECIES: DUF3987 domain-containing protein [Bacteroidales]|uniref:DUF3987 domain-containing protein n=1 Tax=Bacteroidales TaxID=171549 RepID=UPI00261BC263|nr:MULTISPECIES: DUF3987 domain-containing protein [Bacteroidales]